MAFLVGERRTCPRAYGGTVITLGNRVVSTGYAGAPAGLPHCLDVGCLVTDPDPGCLRTVHAEVAAITFAAREGITLKNGVLYTSMSPCLNCAKTIINAGIQEVIFEKLYRKTEGLMLLVQAGVSVKMYNLKTHDYEFLEGISDADAPVVS